MRDRPRLGHVDLRAVDLQAGRHDVAELRDLADLALEVGEQQPVVVPVGDEESVVERHERVLHAARHEVVGVGRVVDRPRGGVGDERDVVDVVDAVDAADVRAAHIGSDHADEHVGGVADEGDVEHAAGAGHRQAGRER